MKAQAVTKFLDEYEINSHTIAILPEYALENTLVSRVLEMNNEFYVAQKPTDIVKKSCTYFGSSFKGRTEGTKALIGVTHKSPIAISASKNLFFFPTTSATRKECAWISHVHVKHCVYTPKQYTRVTFINSQCIELDLSLGSFENQLFRTGQLRAAFHDRQSAPLLREFNMVKEDELGDYLKRKKKASSTFEEEDEGEK
ncbi:competence protein ComK [Priestia taiwanensis]|uniref:Competence protein n=1 Tax=Priestia taiwanensis TaxID=1347902 RepID=A0A917AU32_9BACI|nr:competence protein ComK [Priestia taiwanensis]MBM7364228.1 competence protein ComK [Priestia taiwanensis]GGE72698.1 competence protein [Priestia taiwanensis]